LLGAATSKTAAANNPMAVRAPHRAPRAKAVIFLFMAGGPSQLDLFTDKPVLRQLHGQAPPQSFLNGKRFAFLKGTEKLLGSSRRFCAYGNCGQELSDLLPHHQKIVDDVCWLRGMTTDVFNHAPAKLFVNTGSPQPGRPSMGSWITYGIGSESRDLPGFVVLQSGPRGPRGGGALWSSGFLPTCHQGVPFRNGPVPILNLDSPPGTTRQSERQFVDVVAQLNQHKFETTADPEIQTRIAAYETAYRMQSSAPELMQLRDEPQHVLDLYWAVPGQPSYANNCLLARRLVERGVRFVQLYDWGWDSHGGGPSEDLRDGFVKKCRSIDRPIAALLTDLENRGLLAETLVVWGGEFGRTPMNEIRRGNTAGKEGRDHHPFGFTMLLAGGGMAAGKIVGSTDELGYHAVEDRIHVHDLQATILHCLGLDHTRLTYRFQGRDFRLTDVSGHVVEKLLA
jgi:hypothetical protein